MRKGSERDRVETESPVKPSQVPGQCAPRREGCRANFIFNGWPSLKRAWSPKLPWNRPGVQQER